MTKVHVNPPIVRATLPQDRRSAPKMATLEKYECYITYKNSGEDVPTVKGLPGRSAGAAPFLSKLANRCATCDHAEYWHRGKKNRGGCDVGGERFSGRTVPCKCERFKPSVAPSPAPGAGI